MDPSFWSRRTLAIVGLGQIGGSLALALRPLVSRVVGIDRDPAVIDHARRHAWIEAGAVDGWPLLAEADAVVVAVPVADIPEVLARAAPYLRPGCLVSDTGSVKAPVVSRAAEVLPPDVWFTGGHPMAGTERSGPLAADPGLFRGRTYVLTPAPPWPEAACREWAALLEAAGARVRVMDAEEHDRHVALASHLPLLLAVGLARAAAAASPGLPRLPELVAGGFRDTTRVAGGEPTVGADILAANWTHIEDLLPAFRDEIERLVRAARRGDRDELRRLLAEARAFRTELLAAAPAAEPTGDGRGAAPQPAPQPAPREHPSHGKEHELL